MGDSFLYNLGTILDQQFNLSENKTNTLDIIENGQVKTYGKLGDFSSKFDKSAERKYREEGYIKHNLKPKQFEVISQEPDLTILIKKRYASSLRQNTSLDIADKEDRLFYKTSNILFQNKCNQLAAYERLTKIERIVSLENNIQEGVLPLLLDTVDFASQIGLSSLFSPRFTSALEKIRRTIKYNRSNFSTTWIKDESSYFKSSFGQGTGVIELTIANHVRTTTSCTQSGMQCNITLTNPYEIMVITEKDIEQAIADAVNPFNNSQTFQTSQELATNKIELDKKLLNDTRKFRGANPIVFQVNPDTYLGKRVRAIIDGVGYEIKLDVHSDVNDIGDFALNLLTGPTTDVDPVALYGSEELGKQGLTEKEVDLVKDIVKSIFSLLQLQANSKNQIIKHNSETNNLRRKLRLHYLNKHLIQPMDTVHVYMQSKTREDTKVIGGLQNFFTGFGFLQNLDKSLGNLKDQFNTLFYPSNADVQIEKTIFAGADFPNYLWSILRTTFVNDRAGTHVYAGIVTGVSGSYSGGNFSLDVTAKDNMHYFGLSKVNFSPSVDNFNGALLDPVTPLDLKFDSISGAATGDIKLLSENEQILEKSIGPNAVPFRFKSGPYQGRVITSSLSILNQDAHRTNNGIIQQAVYAPSGFVHRWKEGIGTYVQYRNSFENQPNYQVATPKLTEDAFAGQDVMNVLSLLITGEPYNFATFYKTAIQFDSFRATLTESSAASFLATLQNDLRKNNLLWGEFVPFKKLSVSEEAVSKLIAGQTSLLNSNQQYSELLERRARLMDRAMSLGGSTEGPASEALQDVKTDIVNIDAEIATISDTISQQFNQNQESKYFTILGDDISYDNDGFMNNQASLGDKLSSPHIRKTLRRKINYLTRRMMHKVKGNEDMNLFIVDDVYDKDLDLQAFSKALSGQFKLFDSDFRYVSDKIHDVANVLDLEVFADTQGHIQVRPPQFNRVPSSVFNRMINLKSTTGIQIFPQYLQDLYNNQAKSAFDGISIVEDEMRLRAAALGKVSDSEIESLLAGDFTTNAFKFLTNEENGELQDLTKLVKSDKAEDDITVQEAQFDLDKQSKIQFLFDINQRAKFVKTSNLTTSDLSNKTVQDRYDRISDRLFRKTGNPKQSIKSFYPIQSTNSSGKLSSQDILELTKNLAELIAKRQRLIKTAASTLRNLKTGISLDSSGKAQTAALFPDVGSPGKIPEVLEHMIEDESYDDYGPGSGSRYVIRDSQIISYNIHENNPQFTCVNVNGMYAEGLTQAPSNLAFGGGGNAVTTAFAVDYDLWRQYGLTQSHAVDARCLSDPETQLAPYAVSILNRARANIISGNLTILGNEYMQPGEVIYIESRNMLFYVDSVSHNFDYGGSFTTSLTLSYGHNPGEYIPTAFDIIGKVLYKNKDNINVINYRQDSVNNEVHLGTFGFGNELRELVTEGSVFGGPLGEENRKQLVNAIYKANSYFQANGEIGNQSVVEIRYYKGGFNEPSLAELAGYIKKLFNNPGSDNQKITIGNPRGGLSDLQVAVVPLDIRGTDEVRHPSPKAYSVAKSIDELLGKKSTNGNSDSLINNVIDIWLNFEGRK